jgi:hypothetical protein
MREAAAGLALAGCLLIFVSVGSQSWPLVVGWLAASIAIGVIWSRLTQPFRFGLAVSLLPVLVLLTWEGGLFFVPSAVALILASLRGHRSVPA